MKSSQHHPAEDCVYIKFPDQQNELTRLKQVVEEKEKAIKRLEMVLGATCNKAMSNLDNEKVVADEVVELRTKLEEKDKLIREMGECLKPFDKMFNLFGDSIKEVEIKPENNYLITGETILKANQLLRRSDVKAVVG